MSIGSINLRKLLQLFFAEPRHQRSLLLADIRTERSKESGDQSGGGDFYGPIWADMKAHVAGRADISKQTKERIEANPRRKRLYPLLRDSFLEMWNEKMRWRNEPFEFVPENIRGKLSIPDLGLVVKVENTASVKLWDGSHRIIYPYFSERPALPAEGARLGFWVLGQTLPEFDPNDFRIIDLLHRAHFRPTEVGIDGTEESQFIERYNQLLKARQKLIDEKSG